MEKEKALDDYDFSPQKEQIFKIDEEQINKQQLESPLKSQRTETKNKL